VIVRNPITVQEGTAMEHSTSVTSSRFSAFVLCTLAAGIAFGVLTYACASGHFGIQIASTVAMVASGAIASHAVRPIHAALDIVERRGTR
jgi:hypothetical protein